MSLSLMLPRYAAWPEGGLCSDRRTFSSDGTPVLRSFVQTGFCMQADQVRAEVKQMRGR